ncbi:MAG: penicillin-binding protein 2 [bacterium]
MRPIGNINGNRFLRWRGVGVTFLLAAGFMVVSIRLITLQLVNHEYYNEEAFKLHSVSIPIPPKRGRIRDRSGNVLAQSVTVTDVRIDGRLAWEKPDVFDKLESILGVSSSELEKKINPKNRFLLLIENADDDVLQKLRSLRVRSLIFKERMMRIYPNGGEGSHVIGFVNLAELSTAVAGERIKFEMGVNGTERVMDHYLKGVAGERWIVRDCKRREIAAYRRSDRPARDGQDVVLTIDQVVQHIIEMEADQLMQEHNPDAVSILVIKPTTGEILALANRPTFDPNKRSTMTPLNLRNAAIMNTFEPGSTFKLVTLAAALNEGIADLDMPIFCENGQFFYGGKWLHDSHPLGMLTLRDVVAKSSNIGFAKLGLLLGQEKIYQYAKRFCFGQRIQDSAEALWGEEPGTLYPPKRWSALSITRVPVGYEVAVTNLQMAFAYGAVANGGKLMEPRLIKTVVDDGGNIVAQYLPKVLGQVVKPEVAMEMKQAMEGVVSDEGTAERASVRGFTVAGKTGTAQKIVNGVYDKENYIASFIGFLPAEHPEFLVSIVVDGPKSGKYYGGLVAAPAFNHIATQVAQQLNMVTSDATVALVKRGEL